MQLLVHFADWRALRPGLDPSSSEPKKNWSYLAEHKTQTTEKPTNTQDRVSDKKADDNSRETEARRTNIWERALPEGQRHKMIETLPCAREKAYSPRAALNFIWAIATLLGATGHMSADTMGNSVSNLTRLTSLWGWPALATRFTLRLHQPLLLAQGLLLTGKAHVIIMGSRHLTSPSPAHTACGSTSGGQVCHLEASWRRTLFTGDTRSSLGPPGLCAHWPSSWLCATPLLVQCSAGLL